MKQHGRGGGRSGVCHYSHRWPSVWGHGTAGAALSLEPTPNSPVTSPRESVLNPLLLASATCVENESGKCSFGNVSVWRDGGVSWSSAMNPCSAAFQRITHISSAVSRFSFIHPSLSVLKQTSAVASTSSLSQSVFFFFSSPWPLGRFSQLRTGVWFNTTQRVLTFFSCSSRV